MKGDSSKIHGKAANLLLSLMGALLHRSETIPQIISTPLPRSRHRPHDAGFFVYDGVMQQASDSAVPVIRSAHASDAAGIARVHVETWVDAYAGLLPERHLVRLQPHSHAIAWDRRLASLEGRAGTLVAEIGDEIVGFAHFGIGRDGTGRQTTEGEIFMLYVATDWRDQGVGRALMKGAFAALQTGGESSVSVWCLAENRAAIGFYQRLGGKCLAQGRLERVGGEDFPVIGFGWTFD